jgi:hypothetical protein
MINSLWQNISKFMKGNLSKSEYNFKLMDKKVVELVDNIELERSVLNPLKKGLLLNEAKGKYEEINLNSDSNYNKLDTSRNIKILEPCLNYPINYTSWFDYLKKKIIFGNRNQENFNYLFKFFKQYRNVNKEPNNSFSFNSNGKLIGFINEEGEAIISNSETNNISYIIKPNNEGISSFAWDTINPNKLFYSNNNILYECILNENELKLLINKNYLLSKFAKFINCFPSPKGDLLILLYQNGIEIYDLFQNLLYSKTIFTFKFINAIYDYKSTVFIAYTEKEIVIFNLVTFDFKTYNYFPGKILKLINNPENDNIYVFVVDSSKMPNELLMYTLSDISISSDVNLNFNSYQNYDNFYRKYHYVLRPDIFSFQYKLMNYNAKILDVCLSPENFRIGILYEEEISSQTKQNSLYICAMFKDKRDNSLNQVIPLYNFGHIDGCQIVSCDFNKVLNNGNTFLLVRFEKNNFIKTEQIKG